jgi:hypothetical protein
MCRCILAFRSNSSSRCTVGGNKFESAKKYQNKRYTICGVALLSPLRDHPLSNRDSDRGDILDRSDKRCSEHHCSRF